MPKAQMLGTNEYSKLHMLDLSTFSAFELHLGSMSENVWPGWLCE